MSRFFDTNILTYYYTRTDLRKRERAGSLLLEEERIVSTQVLSELANVLSSKVKQSWTIIRGVIHEVCDSFTLIVLTEATVTSAISLAERYKYSYYDSLPLAAAIEAGCSILYSEDSQHNQVIEGVRIVNPFL
ncbi:MAG TPA: PIN domain-containing protein [Candidatus Kapabacteria bacterium]|nr:PIN domain-containing protein [Candidatus Kapabacteria bacterium]